MASVGQVYYDVLPNLDGFAAKVASGLGNAKPIKIPVQADTKAAEASFKNLTSQTGNLSNASARLATAQGKVRVAAAQLNETRQKATQGSSRLVKAEERYAAALRGVQTAQEQDAKAAARAAAVREKASAASARAAERDVAARRNALQSVGTGLLTGGAVAAAAVGGITKVTADFDKAVSNVASTGQEARASIAELRAEAIKYGAATSFSATEAAAAQAELIKANVSVTDTINGGLAGALNLAEAGSLGVADAAGIMGTSLSQFNLSGQQASHVADLLAAGAGKAQGEVTDFAEALKYVGPIANSAGVSIEETTGVIAELANQGILGSQAGTSLRGILLSLTAPAGAGAKAMKEYGINVRDASGNFIGFEGAAAELQKRLGGLTQAERDAALARIFGRNSITAATILYEGGAAGVRKWTDAVNDSGYASDVARTKMDNLSGDLEQLRGALDSAFIQAGGGGTEFFRSLTQGATGAIDAFNGLPPAVQEGTFKLAALAAVGALVVGAGIKIVGAAAAAKTALATLGVTAVGTRAKLALLNGPALLATAGFIAVQAASAGLEDQLEKNSAGIEGYSDSLKRLDVAQLNNQFDKFGSSFLLLGQGVKDTESAFVDLKETFNPVAQGFRRVGDAIGMASTAGILADEFDKIDKALTQMEPEKAAEAFSVLSTQAKNAGLSASEIASTFDDYKKKQNELGESAASSFRQSEIAFRNGATGAREIGAAAQQSAEDLKVLHDEMYAMANAALAMSGSQIAVEAAMDAARDAAKANGETLDINTAKGRANQSALDALASATLNATQAMVDQDKPARDIVETNERAKESWINHAKAMGMGASEARDTADALFAIPADIQSQIVIQGAKVSKQEAKDLNRELDGIPAEQRARIVTIANTKGAKEAQREIAKVKNKQVIARATGKGVNTVKEIDTAIKKLRSKAVRAQANSAGKPAVNALDKAIQALKNKRVKVTAVPSGTGSINAMAGAIARVQSKTVVVTTRTKTVKATAADGAYIEPSWAQRLAGGGPVRGYGGPREDNIAGIDRATGVQTSWVSAREFVVNAAQTESNRAQIETINRGGKWDLIPRRAEGGPVSSGGKGGAATATMAGRPLIINLDMGDLGIRKIVTEIVEDRDEYSASIGRMR